MLFLFGCTVCVLSWGTKPDVEHRRMGGGTLHALFFLLHASHCRSFPGPQRSTLNKQTLVVVSAHRTLQHPRAPKDRSLTDPKRTCSAISDDRRRDDAEDENTKSATSHASHTQSTPHTHPPTSTQITSPHASHHEARLPARPPRPGPLFLHLRVCSIPS